jgi:hypothetical protein
MTDHETQSLAGRALVPAIGGLAGVLITWMTSGWVSNFGAGLLALITVAGGTFGLVVGLLYRRYLGVLGAGGHRKGTPERTSYDAL